LAGQVRDEASVAWVVEHRQALQVAGLAIGFLLLLLLDLSWFGLLLLLGAVGALELWLSRVGEPSVSSEP
jgi:hypothetical protein